MHFEPFQPYIITFTDDDFGNLIGKCAAMNGQVTADFVRS